MDGDGSAHSSLFGDLSTEEVTSKIILTAVIVLFMAVLCVLILHLYAKLYWWRLDHLHQQQEQEQEDQEPPIAPPVITRRQQRRRFIFVPGQDSVPNTGLTPFELSSLPIVLFRQDSFCKDGLECAICLSELVKGDEARLLPKCSHSFHVECIDMWFQSHSTCPICRNPVLGAEQDGSKGIEQVPDNVSDDLSQISSSVSDFPTNVLVWGRQDQVSTRNTNVGSQEDANGSAGSQSYDAVVLDINDSTSRSQNVPSSSSVRFVVEEEEPKSPMTTRLRSLRRFLSRDKRVSCSNSSSSTSSSNAAAASVDP